MRVLIIIFAVCLFGQTILAEPPVRPDQPRDFLDATVIAEINMKEVTLGNTLDFLREVSSKQYRPKEYKGDYPIKRLYSPQKSRVLLSFRFSQITLRDTLTYVCKETGLTWKLKDGIIVIEDKKG